jgi:DnaJ family protein C protein 13
MLLIIYACIVPDVPVPGVEIQCIGHFCLLFGLLSVDSCKPIQHGALNVISSVTQNQECVNDIAASDVLVHLLLILFSLPDAQITALDTLYALMHTTRIVKDALAKGEHVFHLCPKDTLVLFHSPLL